MDGIDILVFQRVWRETKTPDHSKFQHLCNTYHICQYANYISNFQTITRKRRQGQEVVSHVVTCQEVNSILHVLMIIDVFRLAVTFIYSFISISYPFLFSHTFLTLSLSLSLLLLFLPQDYDVIRSMKPA